MNIAVMALAECSPLLFTRQDRADVGNPVVIEELFGHHAHILNQYIAGTIASAVTRLPRVRMILTCDAFLSVAKFDSK